MVVESSRGTLTHVNGHADRGRLSSYNLPGQRSTPASPTSFSFSQAGQGSRRSVRGMVAGEGRPGSTTPSAQARTTGEQQQEEDSSLVLSVSPAPSNHLAAALPFASASAASRTAAAAALASRRYLQVCTETLLLYVGKCIHGYA